MLLCTTSILDEQVPWLFKFRSPESTFLFDDSGLEPPTYYLKKGKFLRLVSNGRFVAKLTRGCKIVTYQLVTCFMQFMLEFEVRFIM